LHFALGRTAGKAGADAAAFGHFAAGNRLKRATLDYDGAATGDNFARAAAAFDAAFFARHQGAGDASALPIVIVGMPRSGTTLVEQILASHPEVHGAGELPELGALATALAARTGGRYPECASAADAAAWGELGADYAAALAALAPDKARVCDKLPGNFSRLGLLRAMAPNAAIIHCRRDPLDTCYSCYSQLFAEGQPFAYEQTELGLYYREYEALMAHWHAVLPGRILEVRYEDVVGDLEGQARRLLEHCGLEWDPRCLEFHTTRRTVRTASLVQVRQPIYSSSIGRWRRHEKELAPLIEALGPLASR
jgi:hypothetical protein